MAKRLIVCSDGTWNRPDQRRGGEIRPTNVVKMWRAIEPVAPGDIRQVKFYDEGVGTEGNFIQRLIGGASGRGLNKNILDGYRFLMHTYEPGDEILLFGFSRGAYTVRSLAGMLRNSGLLQKSNAERLQAAFDLYRREDAPPDSEVATSFRNAYSHEVDIKFLGVWDTVGALGIPPLGLGRFLGVLGRFLNRRHTFHDVELSGSVKYGYHALAIDERRAPFEPSIWVRRSADGQPLPDAPVKEGQVVEQVWFAGHHSDVGGGTKCAGLSDLALKWMMEKAKPWLAFDEEYIKKELHPNHAGPVHDPRRAISKLIGRFKLGTFVRILGTTWLVTEAVHRAATTRYDGDPPVYKPQNLKDYLDGDDPKIAEPDDSHMPASPASAEETVPEHISADR